MRLTTLCYIENNQNEYLMLHRTKKENDQSKNKWLGVGGKFEANESPDECMLREVFEETGIKLSDYIFRGIVTFISDEFETEYMHLFTAVSNTNDLITCNEGDLVWISKDNILDLNLWEGDRIFLKQLMENDSFFSLKLVYESDKLVDSALKIF